MKATDIDFSIFERSHIDYSKQLEASNFATFKQKGSFSVSLNNKIKDVNSYKHVENQYEVFQGALQPMLLWGQIWGLNPFIGVLEKDPTKVRFSIYSWRFLHNLVLWFLQVIVTFLCILKLFRDSINVNNIAFVAFYGSTCVVTVLFMRVASKWPQLVKEVSDSQLNKYADPRIKRRSNIYFLMLLSFSLFEHLLAAIATISRILDCFSRDKNVYEAYIQANFPSVFDMGIEYSIPLAIVLQIVVFMSTVNWNYSDIFIINVSFYLSSLIDNINEKINETRGKNYSIDFWRSLRSDYTRVTRLVSIFDEVVSSIIFVSFGTALFFICSQLFKVLSEGIELQSTMKQCRFYPSGPFRGYEQSIYYIASLAFIFCRFLAVALVASSVHTASMAAAPALYEVASKDYNPEIQRFVDQVHGDTVALSGLKFFLVTKDLILTVAGNIITYELVLLQFRDKTPDRRI